MVDFNTFIDTKNKLRRLENMHDALVNYANLAQLDLKKPTEIQRDLLKIAGEIKDPVE